MSFFSKILDKLGLGKDKTAADTAAKPAVAKPGAAGAGAAGKAPERVAKDDVATPTVSKMTAAPVAGVSVVDVVATLEKKAKGSELDWKVSIVDLLKLLDLDASKDSRIELAKELGCPADLIGGDYSKMNVWLHKEVLKRIAANGGNIPANLLD